MEEAGEVIGVCCRSSCHPIVQQTYVLVDLHDISPFPCEGRCPNFPGTDPHSPKDRSGPAQVREGPCQRGFPLMGYPYKYGGW